LNAEDILCQCRLSAPYGLTTVILDDGWQTEDNNRGYAYCGDWALATAKIPDMSHLVKELHGLDMKVMLWYSVPYVGIHSKSFSLFAGKYLSFDAKRGVACLDPRYGCVREYLAEQYEQAVLKWDLDGVKLDFVNAFRLTPDTPVYDPKRDIPSLETAIEQLLIDVKARLQRLKPDILIEFRQGYIGPAMRCYGNMLRAGDCPRDALCNKTAVLDLRLTSGSTPVHSDMLMWHREEPVESAALQLASVLFSVPQISVRLDQISEKQKQMLRFYLDFWRDNRKLLLEGKLTLYSPEAFYSKATATLSDQELTVLYTDTTVVKGASCTTVVNCGPERRVYLDGFAGQNYTIVDCLGNKTGSGVLTDLCAITLPSAGILLA
jgi:alpha-galactosidase